MLVGAFGMLGLVLATVGVYGVVSYSVSQRTHEIGIRSALGAQRRNVLGMVLKQGMTMALIGTAIGIVLAFLLFRGLALRSLRRCFDGFGHARGSFRFVACHCLCGQLHPGAARHASGSRGCASRTMTFC